VSLVLNDGTGFIPLQLEHPLKGDRAATFPLQIAAPTRVKSSELGLRGTVTLPVRLNMCCCVGAEVGLGRWGLGGCGWPWAEPDPYYNPRVKNKNLHPNTTWFGLGLGQTHGCKITPTPAPVELKTRGSPEIRT
jgi:hypothetical protein